MSYNQTTRDNAMGNKEPKDVQVVIAGGKVQFATDLVTDTSATNVLGNDSERALVFAVKEGDSITQIATIPADKANTLLNVKNNLVPEIANEQGLSALLPK
jgi:hypothetical protein